MFDRILWEAELPDKRTRQLPKNKEWQTKDLACVLDRYTVNKNGKLNLKGEVAEVHLYSGEIQFYTSVGDTLAGNYTWFEFKAKFDKGQLISVEDAGTHDIGNGHTFEEDCPHGKQI